jgi:hypothetical protein
MFRENYKSLEILSQKIFIQSLPRNLAIEPELSEFPDILYILTRLATDI